MATREGRLYPLEHWCPNCGAGHAGVPGRDNTWKCRRCNGPLRRATALNEDQAVERFGVNGDDRRAALAQEGR